jgi:hypothetical protein
VTGLAEWQCIWSGEKKNAGGKNCGGGLSQSRAPSYRVRAAGGR